MWESSKYMCIPMSQVANCDENIYPKLYGDER